MRDHNDNNMHSHLTAKEQRTHALAKQSINSLNLSPMNQNMRLDELPPPKSSQKKIMAIFAVLCAFIIWASLTPIQEIASAAGQIIPSGFVKVIQHLEGGIVKEIFVKDGALVHEGDLLMQLDQVSAKAELDQAIIRQKGLEIQQERLKAFAEQRNPNFPYKNEKALANILETQMSTYAIQNKNFHDQLSVINKQLEQRQASLKAGQQRMNDLQRQLSLSSEIRDMYQGLFSKKLQSKTVFLQAEGNVAKIKTDYNQERNQINETLKSISELENSLSETISHIIHDALKEMGDITTEIIRLDDEIRRLKDRFDRTTIISPANGVVKGLSVHNLRAIIQPAAEIMQIVPQDHIEVEANLNPQDLGNIKEGQNVKVKISSYDYTRFGGIDGKIKSISASTFKDQEGMPFYKVLISLSKTYVGKDPKRNHITPGMTLQADIDTGQKTLMQYLFKPISTAFETSFRER